MRVEPVASSDFDVRSERSTERSTSLSEEDRRSEEALQLSKPIGSFGGVRISVQVETHAKTGVEMEALTGVMGAALTVVDMCKGVDKGCVIDDIKVVKKIGGSRSAMNTWHHRPDERLMELDGRLIETDELVGMGKPQPVDAAPEVPEEEAVVEQADNERMRKAKTWKKWAPDRGDE